MKCAVEVSPGGIVQLRSIMTIVSGIQVIIRLLPQQSEIL
jgi:hypothetical protein